MTEEQLSEMCGKISEAVLNLYAEYCRQIPKAIVITAFTGAFAACAFEGGFTRENTIAALESAFDDIESDVKN